MGGGAGFRELKQYDGRFAHTEISGESDAHLAGDGGRAHPPRPCRRKVPSVAQASAGVLFGSIHSEPSGDGGARIAQAAGRHQAMLRGTRAADTHSGARGVRLPIPESNLEFLNHDEYISRKHSGEE